MELVARHEFANNFTGWVAYTLSRALRTDSGETASACSTSTRRTS